MKKAISLILLFPLCLYAQERDKTTNITLLLNSQDELMSGRYYFNDQSKIDATFIPFSYHLDRNNKNLTYTIKGAAGIGRYITRENTDRFKSLKLGVHLDKKMSQYSRISAQLDLLYSSIQDKYGFYYGLKADFLYQPDIDGYHPYFKLIVNTFSTHQIKNFNDITGALLGKIKIGVRTPHLTSIGSIPLRAEPFFLIASMSRSVREKTDIAHYYKVGLVTYFGSNPIFDWVDHQTFIKKDYLGWIKEITLENSYISGNNFYGFNIGLGINF